MIKRITNIREFVDKKKSVLIFGPRGSGKSFFIQDLLKQKRQEGIQTVYIDLLVDDVYRKYQTNPTLLKQEIEWQLSRDAAFLAICIDEIQKLPVLLDLVHHLIEAFPAQLQFILSGSSARKLKKTHANMLAGRALSFSFYPFCIDEIDMNRHLFQILLHGSLPSSFLEEDVPSRIQYLKTYVATYLKEEILQEAITRKIDIFSKFLECAAFLNGTPINYSKIAKQLRVSYNTVHAHFQILEDTLLVHRISAFDASIKRQLMQAPKYYFFDNGIITALTGELSIELKESSYRFGQLFENLVVNELLKYNSRQNESFRFYHYRTTTGIEIDLIAQKNLQAVPVAIEIKSQVNPRFETVKSLCDIETDFPTAKKIVLCRCDKPYIEKGVTFYPFIEGIKAVFEL